MYTLLEICEPRMEMDAYSYFRWIFNGWTIKFYKLETGMFQFWIDLPFVHINNVMYRRSVSKGTDPMYHTVPVISGKILGWKIKI